MTQMVQKLLFREVILKLTKKNITIIVVIVLFLFVSMYFGLRKDKFIKKYIDNGKVVERIDFRHVVVELETNSVKMDVYSSVFNTDDKLKVEYFKKNGKYVIHKIKSLANTQLEKSRLVSNINNDVILREYKNKISGYSDINSNEFIDDKKVLISKFYVLPNKISNQYYETLNSLEFYKTKNYLIDTEELSIEKDSLVTLNIDLKFKVLSFKNISETEKVDIKFKQVGDEVIFKSLGYGIYEMQVQFRNGDIVDYLFM